MQVSGLAALVVSARSDRPPTSLAPGEHLGFDAVGLADAEGVGIADLLAGAAEGDTVAVIAGEPSA